jgi:hypothetical protein
MTDTDPLLIELSVDKVSLGSSVLGRKVVGTGQGPEITGSSAVVGMNLEIGVVMHHLGGKILEKLHRVGFRLFVKTKLWLDRVVFKGNVRIIKDCLSVVIIIINRVGPIWRGKPLERRGGVWWRGGASHGIGGWWGVGSVGEG